MRVLGGSPFERTASEISFRYRKICLCEPLYVDAKDVVATIMIVRKGRRQLVP